MLKDKDKAVFVQQSVVSYIVIDGRVRKVIAEFSFRSLWNYSLRGVVLMSMCGCGCGCGCGCYFGRGCV